MSSSRRQFLQQASALGLLYGSSRAFGQKSIGDTAPVPDAPHSTAPMLHTLELPPFVDPLPVPEIVRPMLHNGRRSLTVTMREIYAKVHRDIPPTRMWSYGPTAFAPLIEARSGEPLEIRWVNHLPKKHFLPIDYSLHGCGHNVPEVRAVVHLHGARTRSRDDGYPEDWYVPGRSRICHYPMEQESTTLWYHDHAMSLNRLNIYAGLFGMLLIRDEKEEALHLPSGKYEVPLILYDRDFTTDGQLFYGTSGIPGHPWISEFSADGLLVNGKIRPFFDVEPRLYRFRTLNVANSRFFGLSLSNGQPLYQIGSDQGLLAAPVPMHMLDLAPAERADLLIDFSQSAGQTIHLQTRSLNLMEFRVSGQSASRSYSIPSTLRPIQRTPESAAIRTRTLTLHEYKDDYGHSMVMLLNRKRWSEPVTETPRLNTTEIWEFVNLTEDTHPMHLHLVRFQVLDRRPFDVAEYLVNKHLRFTAAATPPDPNELGWKDTVQCPSGMITRILVPFEGYAGRYLYHCHILEHESNEMMRPFEVTA